MIHTSLKLITVKPSHILSFTSSSALGRVVMKSMVIA